MSTATRADPLQLAERAHALVQARPAHAHALAEQALELARRRRDPESRVAALHALGFARYVLGDPRALGTVAAAVRAGERHGYLDRAALARRNLALYLAYAGRTTKAVREMDRVCARLDGVERARTEVFRLAVLHLAGRAGPHLAESERALRVLRRAGDDVWEARLLYNRGFIRAELGLARAAHADLERARDLYATLGSAAAVADARIMLARLRFVEGDVLGSLIDLDAIDASELSDWSACWLSLSRAQALVGLRLLPEARIELGRFVDAAARANAVDSVNKGRLEAARLALLAGDTDTAASLAATARRSFAARKQTTFAAAGTLLSLGAAIRSDRVPASARRAGINAAATLAEAGWTLDALRGRLLVALAAATAGSYRTAAREYQAGRALGRRGTVADRVELRHVEALLKLGDRDPVGADRALRAGLRLLEEYRAALGAIELRATASRIGADLSELGLRLAFESGEPERILAWAERLRGNALRLPFVRPPADPELRALQTELRVVTERIRDERSSAAPTHGLGARQTQLETAIRARSRLVRGASAGHIAAPSRADATRALGNRVLVEYIARNGALCALTLAHGRLLLHDLGELPGLTVELEWMRFALNRLARRDTSPAQRAAAVETVRAAIATLDEALVAPLAAVIDDASLVIVPTGALHVMPWGALPSLRGRPLVVAPSLSTWLSLAGRRPVERKKRALVAGPRLRHAAAEVRALAALLPDATALRGKEATTAAALRALDGSALAHVACHGRFRADNPLFSALELADGPLTALDLQTLRRPPDVLVLSSCDLALSSRHPGDELVGLAAALLAMGTRTIVASVVAVPDARARRLMLAFHSELAGGATPAVALARAQGALGDAAAALAGFVCLGSG